MTPDFANSDPVAEVSFADIWRVLRKRIAIVVASTCGLFALGLAYCLISTPKYESISTIQFNKRNSDSLMTGDVHEMMINDVTAMDYHLTQQTQVDTLKSNTLALQVIQDLKLENRPEFSPKPPLWPDFTKYPNSVRDCRWRRLPTGGRGF